MNDSSEPESLDVEDQGLCTSRSEGGVDTAETEGDEDERLVLAGKDAEKSRVGRTNDAAGSITSICGGVNVPELMLDKISSIESFSVSSSSWRISSRTHHPVPASPITLLTWLSVHPVNLTSRTVHRPEGSPKAEVETPP